MTLNRVAKLHTGAPMPLVGLGTWQSLPGEVEAAVKVALETGYKHFDFAAFYGNEKQIGGVLEEWFANPAHKREDYFFTSKLWNTSHRPEKVPKALEKTLTDLRLEYLDLYLIHWPISSLPDHSPDPNQDLKATWKAMEKLVDTKKTRHIGVSNWTVNYFKDLLPSARIKPAVNQIELHPYLPQTELVKYCQANNIVVTAYSPLGSSSGRSAVREDPAVIDMAKRLNKTSAQVLISYHASRGIVVVPKSTNPDRIKSNFQDFVLSAEDIAILDHLHEKKLHRYCKPSEFFGVKLFDDEFSAQK